MLNSFSLLSHMLRWTPSAVAEALSSEETWTCGWPASSSTPECTVLCQMARRPHFMACWFLCNFLMALT